MKLHELKPALGGQSKARKRVGRGAGSGHGGTSGRGLGGQKSRSGSSIKPGFEGGQMPLIRRMPKRGFTNIFAKKYATINIKDLNRFDESTIVTPELLVEAGLIKKGQIVDGVKILGDGNLEKKLTVKAHRFSKSAAKKIEAAGGRAEVI